jgi:signal transduction histidine kinase
VSRRLLDPAIALVLLVAGELEIWLGDLGGDRVASAALLPLAVLPVALRTRAPVLACAIFAAAAPLQLVTDGVAYDQLASLAAMLLLAYSVPQFAGAALLFAGVLASGSLEDGADVAFVLILLAGAVGAGRLVRDRSRQADRLRVLAQENARLAVEAERARIARELHDAVAHAVSIMVVQAGAAEQVLATEPERARPPLLAIQEAGRRAHTELRRMVGILREDGEHATLGPTPGLAHMDGLIDDAALPVTLRVEGTPVDLPTGVDVSAYRIVQEALTNVRKHAAASHAQVTLRYRPDAIDIEVLDDGRGGTVNGRGYGIIGMRERATLFRGELEAGPAPGGGFRVRARLPI